MDYRQLMQTLPVLFIAPHNPEKDKGKFYEETANGTHILVTVNYIPSVGVQLLVKYHGGRWWDRHREAVDQLGKPYRMVKIEEGVMTAGWSCGDREVPQPAAYTTLGPSRIEHIIHKHRLTPNEQIVLRDILSLQQVYDESSEALDFAIAGITRCFRGIPAERRNAVNDAGFEIFQSYNGMKQYIGK